LRVPADRVVYPPAATRHFLDRALALGATVRERTAVERIEPHRVRAGGAWHETDLVVVAAAAASPRLVPALPIEPRRGHLVITDRYPSFLRHQVIELGYHTHALDRESVAFNVQPRRTGQILIGSSRELVGWDPAVNTSVRARMLRRATEFVPGLSALQALRTWVGFRPATPDGLPLIGEWEPGLFVAAGHEGLGVTTSLGTARIITSLALGRPTVIEPRPFDPRRAEVVRG
jgi:glycine/D-amino acid oxidase-like deaminating enzyme